MQWSHLVLFGALAFCAAVALAKNDDAGEVSLADEEHPKILPLRIEGAKKRKSTGDLLRHLGMTRIKNPGNHHRKRLASQSRKSHSGDSHMYVLKLPPNPYYYDPEPTKGADVNHNVNHIPISFKSNGKPGKIYHWNLPVVKKMAARKTSAKSQTENQVFKPSLWVGEEPHKKVSFYKPKKPAKQAFHKYFPGNGKPHALYIIENKKKSSAIHRIKE
ncbi:Hypothetical protein NTJ_12999 [Nesidiocoris tenuis]|uniref:Uncharacterized protein n=1 Tax=Nesidiocoris tenuis TaxID=355587 RepID=A0ABN7B700_9HEMI|nr:Hypothetical protein NTJ_12999 [Nesidiocoris tenuis]